MKKYYALCLESYEGEGSSLTVDADGNDAMYVVLAVDGTHADIIDWGYPSIESLKEAWFNVHFENLDGEGE